MRTCLNLYDDSTISFERAFEAVINYNIEAYHFSLSKDELMSGEFLNEITDVVLKYEMLLIRPRKCNMIMSEYFNFTKMLSSKFIEMECCANINDYIDDEIEEGKYDVKILVLKSKE